MVKRPIEAFWDASNHTQARKNATDKDLTQEEKLNLNPERDKDNAAHAPKPPAFAMVARTNAATRGAIGTKRDLPTPEKDKAQDDFKLTAPNELKREFKSIASGHDKDRGHER